MGQNYTELGVVKIWSPNCMTWQWNDWNVHGRVIKSDKKWTRIMQDAYVWWLHQVSMWVTKKLHQHHPRSTPESVRCLPAENRTSSVSCWLNYHFLEFWTNKTPNLLAQLPNFGVLLAQLPKTKFLEKRPCWFKLHSAPPLVDAKGTPDIVHLTCLDHPQGKGLIGGGATPVKDPQTIKLDSFTRLMIHDWIYGLDFSN